MEAVGQIHVSNFLSYLLLMKTVHKNAALKEKLKGPRTGRKLLQGYQRSLSKAGDKNFLRNVIMYFIATQKKMTRRATRKCKYSRISNGLTLSYYDYLYYYCLLFFNSMWKKKDSNQLKLIWIFFFFTAFTLIVQTTGLAKLLITKLKVVKWPWHVAFAYLSTCYSSFFS